MNKNDLKFRIGFNDDGSQFFKMIIGHPMETGLRKDRKTGKKIPADYIDELLVSVDAKPCFGINMSENVSKNPFVHFTFTKPVGDGQSIEVSWYDNQRRQTVHKSLMPEGSNGRHGYGVQVQASTKVVPAITTEPKAVCDNESKAKQ